jgi:hypothetical protein
VEACSNRIEPHVKLHYARPLPPCAWSRAAWTSPRGCFLTRQSRSGRPIFSTPTRPPARGRRLRPRLRLHRTAGRPDASASGDRAKHRRSAPAHQGALRAADDLLRRRHRSDPCLDGIGPVTRQFQAAIGELPFDGGAAFWAVHCPGLRCRSNVHIGASTKKIFVDTTMTQKCTVSDGSAHDTTTY